MDRNWILCVGETTNARLSVYELQGKQLLLQSEQTDYGAQVFVANYDSGSVSVIDLFQDGRLSSTHTIAFRREGVGKVAARQEKSHAHQVIPSPDSKHVYVCDLGCDAIHVLSVGQTAQYALHRSSITVPAGSGPRHLVFHQNRAFVTMELSCEVQAFRWDGVSLFAQGEPVRLSPPGRHLETLAEVALSPDGQFLYVSCRGDPHEDAIALLRVCHGELGKVEYFPSGGCVPRHFSLSPDGKWLAVANQGSGSLVLLERDEKTGRLNIVSTHRSTLINYAGFH
ncbi:hypothetical protein MYAM1_002696 [Malassezia yamatoensis]|uniref:6-phosphogluconolactonase n=1 Tax=Malassezia yamatoensis TaxID=253288 RepID=A0AAJ5YV26_9BASI|nr:hypothetical protein MYAM1_002696 [Malassezia yamatoensis]